VTLFHDRRPAIDGGGDGKVLIGNAPNQFYASGVFGVGFAEAGDFAEAVENEADAFAVAGFSEILLHAGGTPEGSDVGAGDEQHVLGKIGDEAAGGIEARGNVTTT